MSSSSNDRGSGLAVSGGERVALAVAVAIGAVVVSRLLQRRGRVGRTTEPPNAGERASQARAEDVALAMRYDRYAG